ncbi:A disintegrin and metalloproteinase with thrombospondin motifs 12 [Gadus morhua]|uniref:ADAM metallopeptidase with thrombospondin type 1 motif, 12 n=1 Tax=Gadus morhua TaxID=8049 RepID=A0A8C5ACV0_GADMO|nr:A disintegrin and metalloproteinase with thrombospondin motifs 12-like [Gadus morhua]
MQCSQESRVLFFLLHFVFLLASGHDELSEFGSFLSPRKDDLHATESDLPIVHPVKVDFDGRFISHTLSHHFGNGRLKRDLRPLEPETESQRVYYQIDYKGRSLIFNLTANTQLVSLDYVVERRNGSLNRTTEQHHRLPSAGDLCHLIGTVTVNQARGTAAVSTCSGLRGLFSLPEGHFFIEPSPGAADEEGRQPHIVYPRVTPEGHRRVRRSSRTQGEHVPCGVKDGPKDSVRVERERDNWETEENRGPSRSQRSVSRERWVETMVVADSKLIDYHGQDNVESYIFTIMNMVAGIFHDASIGNAVHIILVRLILLHGEEKDLKIVHHADTTLSSFCAWQKNLNPQSDTHPAHHDVAVLVTRKDICAGMNQPCETLGLSHLSGMCQPHRSCNINEDSGLPVAFTIAHEMGHSFGIHHDGQGNDCELQGRHPFIMSRQLMYDSSPLTWSSCSKEYITRFLDRGWGFCLDDRPSKRDLTTPLARLGVRYTTHHQCQLQYGPDATFCPEVDNVCQILWCSVNGTCRSKLDSPIDGTRCGPEKWCISGECVVVGKLPETVNGAWGQWSTWSHCSRTCGSGVQSAERECNSPKPEFGGKYCTGERKRYRTCNTKRCQKNIPSFREMLCSEFDTVPYQNELYKWIPVANPVGPCELHCRPVTEYFSEKMLDAVTDGTPCFMNNNSRSICVNGVCKEVGCDYGIDSNAVEDRCGVCLGDGSSCETVYKTFDGGEGFGYVDVGVIPRGARDILVQEVEEAGNFLALRGPEPEDYFLNGHYIIQWNGEYEAGGTTFYYERSGNMENLTAPGPTKNPVVLQLLYQETNPGIKYEYTVKKTPTTGNEVTDPVYIWRYGAWTDCSTTCGQGQQQQPARCFEVDMGVVDETLCDPNVRLEDRHRKCKSMDCPARWWVGGWQHCSATCGVDGVRKRTVLCVRTVTGEERVLHPLDCKHLLKPKPMVPCSRDVACGQDWAVGAWEECPVSCGGAVRSRSVTCVLAPRKSCDLTTKPRSRSLCALQSCPNSSLRRRPGPPTKYRRLFPPKSKSDTTTVRPRVPTTPVTTSAPSTPSPTSPLWETTVAPGDATTGALDGDDDYEFDITVKGNLIVKKENGGKPPPTEASALAENPEGNRAEEEEKDGEEEGSTGDGVTYSPAFDSENEKTMNEKDIIDLDVTPAAKIAVAPIQSPGPTTPRLHMAVPTLRPTQAPARTTRAPATKAYTTTPRATIHHTMAAQTTRRYTLFGPHTTPLSDPYVDRSHRVHHTTTAKPRSHWVPLNHHRPPATQAPESFTKRTFTSTDRPPTTGRHAKLKKPGDSPKKNNRTAPESKRHLAPAKDDTHPAKPRPRPKRPAVSDSSGNESNPTAARPATRDVFWVAGNWSECSTSCGIGAVWRTVACSSQSDEDCVSLQRPEPARTCHLQPCATWLNTNWTKCPEDCAVVGRRQRDVQCVDAQTKRPLRPFHCQALSSRPPSSLPCPHRPCLTWDTSPWGECSRSCGDGARERQVTCPLLRRCSASGRPTSTEPCPPRACPRWEPRGWSPCSVSCGGGVQQRLMECVSVEDSAVMDDALCDEIPRPDTHGKCNLQECKDRTAAPCKKNNISSRFCDKLKLLGRCSMRSVQRQCCVTCGA